MIRKHQLKKLSNKFFRIIRINSREQLHKNLVCFFDLIKFLHFHHPFSNQRPFSKIFTSQQQELYFKETTKISQTGLVPNQIFPLPAPEKASLYFIQHYIHISPRIFLNKLLINHSFPILRKQFVRDIVMTFPSLSMMKIQIFINLTSQDVVLLGIPVFSCLRVFTADISHNCVTLVQGQLVLWVVYAWHCSMRIHLEVFGCFVLFLDHTGLNYLVWCFCKLKQ